MAKQLDDLYEVMIAPIVRIEPCDVSITLDKNTLLIATSVHGLPAVPQGHRGPIAVVGGQTADAAQRQHLSVEHVAETAEALCNYLLTQGQTGPVHYLRGDLITLDLAARLRGAGWEVSETIVYQQVAQNLSDPARAWLQGDKPVVLPLFSANAADQIMRVAFDANRHIFVSMSAAIDGRLEKIEPNRRHISSHPRGAAMVDLLRGLAS